jgi:hypothetical protein
MTPANDPARSEVVFADQGVILFDDGVVHEIAVDNLIREDGGAVFFEAGGSIHPIAEATGFDLRYEADSALAKQRTDIVVAGYRAHAANSTVTVSGSVWMRRAAIVTDDRDTDRNLFGWQPRAVAPRHFPGAPEEPESPDLGPISNNFYRRDTGFSTPGNNNAAPLPSAGEIEIRKPGAPGDGLFAFALPDLAYHARYRVYCGHGPDEAPYWRIGEIGSLRPDTLIVWPGELRATILWRAAWEWGAEPAEHYRKIQILEGSG